MTANRAKLPIFDSRKAILDAIMDNQVIMVAGDTGCGKTTQVRPPACPPS